MKLGDEESNSIYSVKRAVEPFEYNQLPISYRYLIVWMYDEPAVTVYRICTNILPREVLRRIFVRYVKYVLCHRLDYVLVPQLLLPFAPELFPPFSLKLRKELRVAAYLSQGSHGTVK